MEHGTRNSIKFTKTHVPATLEGSDAIEPGWAPYTTNDAGRGGPAAGAGYPSVRSSATTKPTSDTVHPPVHTPDDCAQGHVPHPCRIHAHDRAGVANRTTATGPQWEWYWCCRRPSSGRHCRRPSSGRRRRPSSGCRCRRPSSGRRRRPSSGRCLRRPRTDRRCRSWTATTAYSCRIPSGALLRVWSHYPQGKGLSAQADMHSARGCLQAMAGLAKRTRRTGRGTWSGKSWGFCWEARGPEPGLWPNNRL